MSRLLPLVALVLFAALMNVPLGYLRQNHEKFTFGWYFYVHISIPVIIYLRVKLDFGWKIIPLTLGAAIVGQLVGGKMRLRKENHG